MKRQKFWNEPLTSLTSNITITAVVFLALAVLLDWCLGEPYYHRIRADWVTMKFSTAVLFLLMVMCINCKKYRILCDGIALIIITYSLASLTIGFGPFEANPIRSVGSGIPSIATIGCFILTSFTTAIGKWQTLVAVTLRIVFLCCCAGYLFDITWLTFEFEARSTAMAFSTAVGFMLISFNLE